MTPRGTLQQVREAIGLDDLFQPLLHYRDGIFAGHVDESVHRLGLKALKSPARCPDANAIYKRLSGTIRRKAPPIARGGMRSARSLESMDPALQSRPSAYGLWARKSRFSDRRQPEIRFTIPPRRVLCRGGRTQFLWTPPRLPSCCRVIQIVANDDRAGMICKGNRLTEYSGTRSRAPSP